MQCNMCGTETRLLKAEIEGCEMNVCSKCARFGKIISRKPIVEQKKVKYAKMERAPKMEIIVANFSTIIKRKRERIGLKQAELAKKLAERESLVHKLETGNFVPGVKLARKIEKILRVKLIEEYKEEIGQDKPQVNKGSSFTLGDFVVKRRNK